MTSIQETGPSWGLNFVSYKMRVFLAKRVPAVSYMMFLISMYLLYFESKARKIWWGSQVQNLLQCMCLCLKPPPTSFEEIASDLGRGGEGYQWYRIRFHCQIFYIRLTSEKILLGVPKKVTDF